jgi:pimeloyl-ACP methyl ester carboxylesterase
MWLFSLRLWHIWDAVSCPVLVLRGAKSHSLSAKTAAAMQKHGPQRVEVVEFLNISHAPSLMKADQIAVIQDWIEKN